MTGMKMKGQTEKVILKLFEVGRIDGDWNWFLIDALDFSGWFDASQRE